MDVNEILKTILEAPFYVWIILFFVLAYLFRDKTRWEKEVKFPHKEVYCPITTSWFVRFRQIKMMAVAETISKVVIYKNRVPATE